MISIEKIKAYIKCPQFGDLEYGKWWETLGLEERVAYRKLIEEIDSADEVIKEQSFEIERLNNIINELNNAYCKVITKCEEMINSRWYMNVYAIKKYAGEIIDICKYYVGEVKKLKGDSSNE